MPICSYRTIVIIHGRPKCKLCYRMWYEMIHISDCGCVIGVEIHEIYGGSIVMDGSRKYE